MFSRLLPLFFLFTSCALFKAQPSLKDKNIEELLSKVKSEGEGRGRLTSGGQQNVFSFESALKENTDWILAVSIPLHGEELMLVPKLKEPRTKKSELQGFDQRLKQALTQELGSPKLAAEYIHSLRGFLRLLNHKALSLPLTCRPEGDVTLCQLESETYKLRVVKNALEIETDDKIKVSALNLTDSFFSQTVFSLRSPQKELLTLELFWK